MKFLNPINSCLHVKVFIAACIAIILSPVYAYATNNCIKVGVIGEFSKPTTGYTRYFGKEAYRGASVALNEMNTHSKRCYSLIKIETNNELANISPLIETNAKKGIHIYLGLGISSQIDVAINSLRKTKSVLLSPTASNDHIDNYARIISLFPSQSQVAIKLTKYLLKKKVAKIDIIYSENHLYSRYMTQLFTNHFTNAGGKVDKTIALNSNSLSLQPYKKTLLQQKPRYVFIPMTDLNAAKIILELERIGVHAMIIGSDSWASYAGPLQKLINQNITSRKINAVIPIMYQPSMKNKTNSTFVHSFESKFGAKPNDLEAFSYDGLRLINNALNYCTLKKFKATPRQCFIKALPFESTTGMLEKGSKMTINRPIKMLELSLGRQDG